MGESQYSLGYYGQVIAVPLGELSVGRSSKCDVTLSDPTVSRTHALFVATPAEFCVKDLSKTGVLVNDEPIEGSRKLALGDLVTVGEQVLRVLGARASRSEFPTSEVRAAMSAQRIHRGKVLVVDDSASVREALKVGLEAEGYEVVTSESPFGVSAVLAQEKPDLVLLDLRMPGLTGDQIVRHLRTTGDSHRARLVIYSARPVEELQQIARECNADGYIQKTTDLGDLLASVRAWAWSWQKR